MAYDASLCLSCQTPPSIFPLPKIEQGSDEKRYSLQTLFRVSSFYLAYFIFVYPDLYALHVCVRCVKREKELLPLEIRRRSGQEASPVAKAREYVMLRAC